MGVILPDMEREEKKTKGVFSFYSCPCFLHFNLENTIFFLLKEKLGEKKDVGKL